MEEDADTVRGNINHYRRLLAGDIPEERRRIVEVLLAELEARPLPQSLDIRSVRYDATENGDGMDPVGK